MNENEYPVSVKLLAVTNWLGFPDSDYPREALVNLSETEYLIEYAGRKCYATENKIGTNPKWIQHRIQDGHESILEHASLTVEIRASRVFTHELVRHRIASYSQRSQRYVNESEPKYITPPEMYGRYFGGDQQTGVPTGQLFRTIMERCWDTYRMLLEAGVPREIARYVLPNACETQIVMTMNFRELRHFIKQRTSKRALPEMRQIARQILRICLSVAPRVFEDLANRLNEDIQD